MPNLTLGLPVVESLLKATDIPMDCHLMIEDPARWAPGYAEAGAYNVTFHAEATDDPVPVARDIRAAGARAGLSVKPGTPLEPYLDILRDFDTLLIMSVESRASAGRASSRRCWSRPRPRDGSWTPAS